jgi:hypothetical protein
LAGPAPSGITCGILVGDTGFEGLKAPSAEVVDPVFAIGCEIEEAVFDSAVVPGRDGKPIDFRDSARIALAQHIRELGFSGAFSLPEGVGACVRLSGR